MTRQQLLAELHRLRKAGWEQPILPYNIPFHDDKADNWRLYHHIRKIKAYRQKTIQSRISLILKVVGFVVVIAMLIMNGVIRKG